MNESKKKIKATDEVIKVQSDLTIKEVVLIYYQVGKEERERKGDGERNRRKERENGEEEESIRK